MVIFIENFYSNANQIYDIVSKLDYKQETFGLEIKDFYLVPQGIDNGFSQIVNKNISLGKKSGCFRKPYEFIHFENFEPKSYFLAIVALTDTKFYTYRHKEKSYSQVIQLQENLEEFISKNCNNKSAWDITCQVNMSPGDMVLVKPWLWHSIDPGIVNVFYLEITDQVVTDTSDQVVLSVKNEEQVENKEIQSDLMIGENVLPTPDFCSDKGTC
jgi:hypothetical protein